MREKDYPYTELDSDTAQYYNTGDRCFRCPICNKVFFVMNTDDYIYKIKNKYNRVRTLCSYNCTNKAKSILKDVKVDRRKKPIHYPESYPTNWNEVYARWYDKAITKAEAIRIMDISSTKVFNRLADYYEEMKLRQELYT